MDDKTIAIIFIIVVLAAYYLSTNKGSGTTNNIKSNQSSTIPEGTQGLDYLKRQYASQLPQAQSLCSSQFKGNWVDNSNSIGCYNMQGFSTFYCGADTIKNLINLCNSIGGNSVCSSTQASCTV